MTYKVALSSMTLVGKIPPGDPLGTRSTVHSQRGTGHLPDWRERVRRPAADHLARERLAHDRKLHAGPTPGPRHGHRGRTPTLPVLLANKFISRHAAIVHTTTSHTPEAPRACVLFLLDAPIMQATNYALAARRCCGCLDPLTAPAKTRFVFGMGRWLRS